ncbi:hypothetical protein [Streptomyces sp. AK010]|uniref:hypothetical protein n=1 Tax=Streptomyces sp. AK010 TaxID=2723074 RepID=UPI001622D8EB|nr:hypothetical protein [Streptomyces sp. AK010]MBB6418170.1 hypothetical protein [Streptomyces sp. AK010]
MSVTTALLESPPAGRSRLDRAVVLERLTAAAHIRVARYRELQANVNGLDPQPTYDEEFAWVVAALQARTAG